MDVCARRGAARLHGVAGESPRAYPVAGAHRGRAFDRGICRARMASGVGGGLRDGDTAVRRAGALGLRDSAPARAVDWIVRGPHDPRAPGWPHAFAIRAGSRDSFVEAVWNRTADPSRN